MDRILPQNDSDKKQAAFFFEGEKMEPARTQFTQVEKNDAAPVQKLWEAAIDWVAANMALVRQVVTPYRRHMAANMADIEQEAVIAAFHALRATVRKKQPEEFDRFFSVIFRTNCVRLASGIKTMDGQKLDNIAAPERNNLLEAGTEHEVINKALHSMTLRQRQVCYWLLMQPEPVGAPDIARQFNISRRQVRRLISGGLARLTGGMQV